MWVSISMMIEVELEIPIQPDSRISSFLIALKNVQIVETLEFGSDGVTFLCKATPKQWEVMQDYLGSSKDENNVLTILSAKRDGTVIFLAEGKWTGGAPENKANHEKDMLFFKQWERMTQIYSIGQPQVTSHSIKTIGLAQSDTIEELLEGLRSHNVNYKVLRMGAPRGKEKTILSALTEKQRLVLRFAYELGYYEIPRKIRTEELAMKFDIDKGTFNDHLRRAEKHVFDNIFQELY